MKKTLTLVILASLFASVISVWILREQNRQLMQELQITRQEKAKLESAVLALPEKQPVSEPAKTEVAESELLRLRGQAARAARAEAEVAELQQKLSQAGGRSGAPRFDSQDGDSLATYLGTRVDPPAHIHSLYTKAGVLSAVQLAAEKAQISLRKLSVDDSEFPFLVGVVTDAGDWPKLVEQLKQLEGYEFNGSVGNDTSHTLCTVPTRTYPAESAQNITRRMNARLEQFYNAFAAAQN